MPMTMIGCQGRDKTPTLSIKTCPQCGGEVEVFSTDVSVDCPQCGFTVYNDAVSCVQWCQYARSCVGDEVYEQLMEIARQQKERSSHGEDEVLGEASAREETGVPDIAKSDSGEGRRG